MTMIMNDEEEVIEKKVDGKPKRKPFATWEVKGESYKLKLSTAHICKLEEKFKTNLLNLAGDENGMPPLSNMLYIAHTAMKDWHHGIKLEDVKGMFSDYIDEGGSLTEFYTNVFLSIYQVSGFFTRSMAESMEKKMEDLEEEM